MTDTAREAAIERVRAYVEAWSGYKDSAVACMRSDSPLILGDLRLLLTDRQPSEAMRGTAQTALKWNMAKRQIEPPVTADEGWRPIEATWREIVEPLGYTAIFNAIGAAVRQEAGGTAISVERFLAALPPAPPTGEGEPQGEES